MSDHLKPPIDFSDFLKLDIRVGTIVSARINEKARKAAYVLSIDFGNTIGEKTSSAQITEHYTPEGLIGTRVLAVMNFPPRKVADILSEVLLLAVVCDTNGTILIRPDGDVDNGMPLL